ncbi:MAG: hypothetical protein MJA83_14905 [Gammaproteobacteria bacterium]|nr:hypothetical protein [Gammaproteobacteria bacterium]
MKRFSDEDLILYLYGELDAETARELEAAVQSDTTLADKLIELRTLYKVIDQTEVPERDGNYGRRVWARVEPSLAQTPSATKFFNWFGKDWLAPAGAAFSVLFLVAVSFYAGRMWQVAEQPVLVQAQPLSEITQQRVLHQNLVNHLDGSQRLLMEVSNRETAEQVDLEAERNWARTLLVANRLYRFAAEQSGQRRIAQVLEDMEPVLIELANSDEDLSAEQIDALRDRIANRDLLFKVRSINNGLDPVNPRSL